MPTPKISVIIPLNNGQTVTDLTLRSLAEQTYDNFEIIIVNAKYPYEPNKECNPFEGHPLMKKVMELLEEIAINSKSKPDNSTKTEMNTSQDEDKNYNLFLNNCYMRITDIFNDSIKRINKITSSGKPRFGNDKTLLTNPIVGYAKNWKHEPNDVKPRLEDKMRIINCPNYSLSHLKNIGINNANGEYICIFTHNVCIAPEAFSEIINVAEREKSDIISFCYTTSSFSGKSISFRSRRYHEDCIAGCKEEVSGYIWSLFSSNIMDNCFNKAYRREFIVNKGIKFPVQTLAWAEDKYFNYSAYAVAESLVNIEDNLISNLLYVDSIKTSEYVQPSIIKSEIAAYEKAVDMLKAHGLGERCGELDKWFILNIYGVIVLPAGDKSNTHIGELIRYFEQSISSPEILAVLENNKYIYYLWIGLIDYLRMTLAYYDDVSAHVDISDKYQLTYSQFQKSQDTYWYIIMNMAFKDTAHHESLFYNAVLGVVFGFFAAYTDNSYLNKASGYLDKTIGHANNPYKLGQRYYDEVKLKSSL